MWYEPNKAASHGLGVGAICDRPVAILEDDDDPVEDEVIEHHRGVHLNQGATHGSNGASQFGESLRERGSILLCHPGDDAVEDGLQLALLRGVQAAPPLQGGEVDVVLQRAARPFGRRGHERRLFQRDHGLRELPQPLREVPGLLRAHTIVLVQPVFHGDGEGGGVLGFVQGQTGERVVTAGDDGVSLVFEA